MFDISVPKIILASASPRRRDLLSSLGWAFEVYNPQVDETPVEGESPADLCARLSVAKARDVKNDDALVIAADTVVAVGGEIFGKPADEADAFKMLSVLSGKEHRVFTGVAVSFGGKTICRVEETAVRFHSLSSGDIMAYIKTGEPMDKAGAYAVQGLGSLLVKKIDGDYFNVVGLPLQLLGNMFRELGFSLSEQFNLGARKLT